MSVQKTFMRKEETFALLTVSSIITYCYGSRVGVAAIFFYTAAKIIAFVENKKVFQDILKKNGAEIRAITQEKDEQIQALKQALRRTKPQIKALNLRLRSIQESNL